MLCLPLILRVKPNSSKGTFLTVIFKRLHAYEEDIMFPREKVNRCFIISNSKKKYDTVLLSLFLTFLSIVLTYSDSMRKGRK